MTITLFDQFFDGELLTKITEAVNSDSEKITIYLCSDGGIVSVCSVLLDIINNNKDRFKLVGFENLYSSSFEFFIKAECEKELLYNTLGMIHQSSRSIYLNDDLNGSNENNKAIMKRVKEYTKPNDDIFIKKLGLTPKEFNEYKKGNDVYFQYNRFLEIINNYKINLK